MGNDRQFRPELGCRQRAGHFCVVFHKASDISSITEEGTNLRPVGGHRPVLDNLNVDRNRSDALSTDHVPRILDALLEQLTLGGLELEPGLLVGMQDLIQSFKVSRQILGADNCVV
jgi:hypothetical protein